MNFEAHVEGDEGHRLVEKKEEGIFREEKSISISMYLGVRKSYVGIAFRMMKV